MAKLKAYHRPATVDEALQLLARPGTRILAGGTALVPQMAEADDDVVDLQAVGLDSVEVAGERLALGAMVRLQTIVENPDAPALVRELAHREGPNTFRHQGTIGGVIAQADPESELLAALLVFEAEVEIQSAAGSRTLSLAEVLANVPAALADGLITAVSLATDGASASERVARTPADKPIVAAVARRDGQGQLRLALCGVATAPILTDPTPDQLKARLNPPGDFRGSTEYRRQMAVTLSQRVLAAVG